ncbi:hypothetical protein RN001_001654 [Aquatica leii]|uniref:Tubulin epsilon and delta complex protein 1 domain-containing protein n=1 Tax=Aquatica leii TaxID=1421715 RepID=A0AAN7PGG8_9COLE|nr:hypothetical protein RN001_001654 [Aquatica leii]
MKDERQIKPESFRLAKFNKTEDNVVYTFWILLGKILNLPQSGNIVQSIKTYFLKVLKYRNAHFYAVPNNMSSGSRELLLAFAYLVGKNYLNKHLINLISNSLFNPDLQLEDNEVCLNNCSLNLNQIKNERDFKNMLKWIEGQIIFNHREYQEYRGGLYNLWLKKNGYNVNTCPNISSLNEIEIHALCSEKDGREFLEGTEIVSKVLHSHIKWLQVQSEFWEWMNSVLLERQKNINKLNLKELNNYVDSI